MATETDTGLPGGATDVAPGDSLCATVDDTNQILELIYSNSDGIYVRDNGHWVLIDTDVPQPTVDDLEWLDVSPAFVPAFDGMVSSQDAVSRDEAAKFATSPDQEAPE